jgi:hypothetical protein
MLALAAMQDALCAVLWLWPCAVARRGRSTACALPLLMLQQKTPSSPVTSHPTDRPAHHLLFLVFLSSYAKIYLHET